MLQEACSKVRATFYGILATTQKGGVDYGTTGTGFMIAPGVIATVAHLVRVGMDPAADVYDQFEVIVPHGASCGSLGYPLAYVETVESGRNFVLIERFQGANISSYHTESTPEGDLDWYETDSLMYSGSSGCPGFLVDGKVFGMQVRSLTRIEDFSPDERGSLQETRIAISQWAPAHDILSIARNQGLGL
jgi:hypothetical protein